MVEGTVSANRQLNQAVDETGLPLVTFPEACPWTVEQVLDEDFLPEPNA